MKRALKICAALAAVVVVIAVPACVLLKQSRDREIYDGKVRDHAIAREKVCCAHDDTVVVADDDYADDPDE